MDQAMPLAGYNDVRAKGDFRNPFGPSQTDRNRELSFGFAVKRHFRFNDPLYQTLSRFCRNSASLDVDMMELRFGTYGKRHGINVAGFNALRAKTLIDAAESGDDGVPEWVR